MHASLSSQIKNVANEKQKNNNEKETQKPSVFFSLRQMQVFFLSWGGKNLRSHLVVQSTNVNVHVLGRLLSFDVFFFFSSVNEVDMCSFYDSAYIEQLHFIRGRPSLAPLPMKFEETSDAIRHVSLPFNGGAQRGSLREQSDVEC